MRNYFIALAGSGTFLGFLAHWVLPKYGPPFTIASVILTVVGVALLIAERFNRRIK